MIWLETFKKKRTILPKVSFIAPLTGADEQGRNERGKGGAIPRAPNHCSEAGAQCLRRAPKSPNNNVNTVHLFPKDLSSNLGAPNFLLAPGAN